MSADHDGESNGPKYDADQRRSMLVEDEVALTHHAINRYDRRTPADCPVEIRDAYDRGEDIRDPQVARGPNDPRTPERARVYVHPNHLFGVVFLINKDQKPAAKQLPHHTADYIVSTVMNIGGINHGPSKAYLHSYGPHGGVEQ